jgi:cell division protein FtsW
MTPKVKASAGKGRPKPGSGIAAAVQQMPTATLLLITVTLLCIFGLVMVGSASSVISISLYGTPWAILVREAMWMAVGGLVLFLAIRFDYRKLRRWSPLLLLVTFGLLCVVLVPGLGLHVEGSSRWIGVGQLRIQPSEVMKLTLTIFAADFIARRLDAGSADRRIMGPLLMVTAAAGVLILAQPDMGTAIVIGCIALTMLFVSGVSLGPVLKLLGVVVAIGLVVAVASAVVPRPVGPRQRLGVPGGAVVDRLGLGTPARLRARRWATEVGLPAQRPHRLHFFGHR